MLFPTASFALFFALVYPTYWLLRWRSHAWKLFILGASYVFYSYWNWRFVLLIIASSVVNAALARRIARRAAAGRRTTLVAAVVFNLALLGVFKYYGFFVASLDTLLRRIGLPVPLPVLEVVVPVGISFFTFQAISYVVDVYRRTVPPAPLLDFAVYLAFFPHLVAGPIVRAAEFLPQLRGPRRLARRQASRAAVLIGWGLFKKVVISSYVAAAIVNPVFAVPEQHSAPEIIAAIYGYAVQIYADFSGYTDMAIGIALLLGITFPPNFDRPYSAASLQEFWRRWHMTLSRWLRDYLYIPLGGSRGGEATTYRNLFLTMLLGGLWHGAAWTFVAWGAFHGAALVTERWIGQVRGHVRAPWTAPRPGGARARHARTAATRGHWRTSGTSGTWGTWAGRLVTFNLVCVGWVLFRADSLETAATMLRRSVTAWGPAPAVTAVLVVVIAGTLALQFVPPAVGQRLEASLAALPLPVQGAAVGAFLALAAVLGPEGVAPFIYYQF
jgi:D-alanyl-lipoteichoic acid acyltransferase DltB (MBOAT superfamily)